MQRMGRYNNDKAMGQEICDMAPSYQPASIYEISDSDSYLSLGYGLTTPPLYSIGGEGVYSRGSAWALLCLYGQGMLYSMRCAV